MALRRRQARPFTAELAPTRVSPGQGLLSLLGPTIPCRGRTFTCKHVKDRRLHIGICFLDAARFRENCVCAMFISGYSMPAGAGVERGFRVFFAASAMVRPWQRPADARRRDSRAKRAVCGPQRGTPHRRAQAASFPSVHWAGSVGQDVLVVGHRIHVVARLAALSMWCHIAPAHCGHLESCLWWDVRRLSNRYSESTTRSRRWSGVFLNLDVPWIWRSFINQQMRVG